MYNNKNCATNPEIVKENGLNKDESSGLECPYGVKKFWVQTHKCGLLLCDGNQTLTMRADSGGEV